MKKLTALLLATAMTASLAACGGNSDGNSSGNGSSGETGSVYYLNFKPEFDEALQDLAKTYTAETGVNVKVVTAASGTYSETLTAEMAKSEAPTIFNIGTTAGLADWDSYAMDLNGTAIAAELNTNEFNLYNDAGELKALGHCYESFGIIVNTDLLAEAGYSLDDIYNYETLKAVAEDIHARSATLGFDAFSTPGLDGSSSWRFSGHLATMPLHYQGVDSEVATITADYLDLFKNTWDLYINNCSTASTALSTATLDESCGEFKNGKAVFYQNGTWEYSGLIEAGMTDDQLTMIPIYCGAEGEENTALCSGTENRWAINANASDADKQASIDFLVWLVTDPDASAVYVDELGAVPFKNCPTSTNKFVADGNELLASGKTAITWAFNYTPNVDSWRATVVTALTDYSAGNADWSAVETAFVDGWAYEYSVVHG